MKFEEHIISCFIVIILSIILSLIAYELTAYGIEIQITSPMKGKEVPLGKLTISGTSSDNATAQCHVYVDWNNQKPYQQAIGTGHGGLDDFSTWEFTYSSNYHLIQEGINDLTSKLTCANNSNSSLVKWYSINVTGINSNSHQDSELSLPTPQLDENNEDTQIPLGVSNSMKDLNSNKINLQAELEKNPITVGDEQSLSIVALDPDSGLRIPTVIIDGIVKDAFGNIIRKFSDNDGSLSPTWKIKKEFEGRYSVIVNASLPGDTEPTVTKSLVYDVVE